MSTSRVVIPCSAQRSAARSSCCSARSRDAGRAVHACKSACVDSSRGVVGVIARTDNGAVGSRRCRAARARSSCREVLGGSPRRSCSARRGSPAASRSRASRVATAGSSPPLGLLSRTTSRAAASCSRPALGPACVPSTEARANRASTSAVALPVLPRACSMSRVRPSTAPSSSPPSARARYPANDPPTQPLAAPSPPWSRSHRSNRAAHERARMTSPRTHASSASVAARRPSPRVPLRNGSSRTSSSSCCAVTTSPRCRAARARSSGAACRELVDHASPNLACARAAQVSMRTRSPSCSANHASRTSASASRSSSSGCCDG